ncbi:hypothetical protein OHA72_33060 [Dactylosporangium sp. NBC_01737]|uniref:hypothetical protein n=1 Tax=Dactylosporangium sp. NBC_01737 TaxID=2975959 RepID=UPI002E1281F6|nr:hypothetical protein OHA72_33060 [Dactylosporangium sp. NBC_01737]
MLQQVNPEAAHAFVGDDEADEFMHRLAALGKDGTGCPDSPPATVHGNHSCRAWAEGAFSPGERAGAAGSLPTAPRSGYGAAVTAGSAMCRAQTRHPAVR